VARVRAGINGGTLGTWIKLAGPESVEIMAHAGFDFVVVDLEHTTLDLGAASAHIAMARACSTVSTCGTTTPAAPASSTRWMTLRPWSGTRTSGSTPRARAIAMWAEAAPRSSAVCSRSTTTKSKPA
jgi:hypothetical protein